jgi:ribosomal protein S18 acetylase RimI-like enzyme
MSLFADCRSKDTSLPPLGVSTGLKIRAAEANDLAALAMIAAEREGTTQDIQLKSFEMLLSQKQARGQFIILVADVCGEVIGFGKCGFFTPPDDAPYNIAPKGWYLMGVIVTPKFRRRQIAHQLTQARLHWLAQRASKAYYFASAQNRVSIELHRQFGFIEATRDFSFPNTIFTGGVGVLFEVDLKSVVSGHWGF